MTVAAQDSEGRRSGPGNSHEALDLPAYLHRVGADGGSSLAPTPETLRALHLADYAEEGPEGVTLTQVSGAEAVLALLAERFDLRFPPGTRFLAADANL